MTTSIRATRQINKNSTQGFNDQFNYMRNSLITSFRITNAIAKLLSTFLERHRHIVTKMSLPYEGTLTLILPILP